MAFTLSTVKTQLQRRLKDIADVSNDDLYQIATALNQLLYVEMVNADPERFITTQSFSVSTAPQTSALPAGFRDTTEYGCGFFFQNADGTASNVELAITGYGSSLVGYYINGTNVVFTGINSSQTVILRYVPVLADITSLAGTFVVPDENKELVLEGMVLYYYRYNEDPRESLADARFARLLAQFIDKLPKNPRVFSLPQMTPYF